MLFAASQEESRRAAASARAEAVGAGADEPLDFDSVVILVDQSGSMRGAHEARSVKAFDSLVTVLESKGVKAAVMAFTTESWKGGQSRRKWIENGKAPRPGRPCDRLHIHYKAFGQPLEVRPEGTRFFFDLAFRSPCMRENLDGEAIEAATAMLSGAGRPDLILVGDASPVDDSTLSANPDDILLDHAVSAMDRAREAGIATAIPRPDDQCVAKDNFPYSAAFDVRANLGPESHTGSTEPDSKVIAKASDRLKRLSAVRHEPRIRPPISTNPDPAPTTPTARARPVAEPRSSRSPTSNGTAQRRRSPKARNRTRTAPSNCLWTNRLRSIKTSPPPKKRKAVRPSASVRGFASCCRDG
jgi:cobaltochelatase CobT